MLIMPWRTEKHVFFRMEDASFRSGDWPSVFEDSITQCVCITETPEVSFKITESFPIRSAASVPDTPSAKEPGLMLIPIKQECRRAHYRRHSTRSSGHPALEEAENIGIQYALHHAEREML